ncbi:hypothetical protein HDV04_001353 [Boothiomyces sp. JEL0838]|nr:hypothetical protein HDV04_001353 [Boothiomyces sp. JEL0838]
MTISPTGKDIYRRDAKVVDHSTNKEIVIHRRSSFTRKYTWSYEGIDYCWKPASVFSVNLELVKYPEKKVVAFYHRNGRFSFRKEGKLSIEPQVFHLTNVILGTVIAAEMWEYGDEENDV